MHRNRKDLIKLLDSLNFHPGRQLGQNFLADENLIDFIIRESGVSRGERVLEVGPGFGALTGALLRAGALVTAIEFDYRICEYLRTEAPHDHMTLIEGDICKVDLEAICGTEPYKCISNLPYSAGSIFIARLFELPNPPAGCFFMLQKEMARRLAADTDDSDFGALSVKMQLLYDVEYVRTVPPDVFFPRPEVDSALVKMSGLSIIPSLEERRFIAEVLRTAFSQRRKKMFKLLAKVYGNEACEAAFGIADISMDARAEAVSPAKFRSLARVLKEKT